MMIKIKLIIETKVYSIMKKLNEKCALGKQDGRNRDGIFKEGFYEALMNMLLLSHAM